MECLFTTTANANAFCRRDERSRFQENPPNGFHGASNP